MVDVARVDGEGDGDDPGIRLPSSGAVDVIPEQPEGADRVLRVDQPGNAEVGMLRRAQILDALGDRIGRAHGVQPLDPDVRHQKRETRGPARHMDRRNHGAAAAAIVVEDQPVVGSAAATSLDRLPSLVGWKEDAILAAGLLLRLAVLADPEAISFREP